MEEDVVAARLDYAAHMRKVMPTARDVATPRHGRPPGPARDHDVVQPGLPYESPSGPRAELKILMALLDILWVHQWDDIIEPRLAATSPAGGPRRPRTGGGRGHHGGPGACGEAEHAESRHGAVTGGLARVDGGRWSPGSARKRF